MQLLVIRHGRAGNREEFARTGADDDFRPLTPSGQERMRRGADGLRRLIDDIDVLATSPLVRARQTAEIVAAEFDAPAITVLDELRPESSPEAFAAWIEDAGAKETIAIVGHNPHLSKLVTWLLTGNTDPFIELRKGAAIMLELQPHDHANGERPRATLLWALTPRQLRKIGG